SRAHSAQGNRSITSSSGGMRTRVAAAATRQVEVHGGGAAEKEDLGMRDRWREIGLLTAVLCGIAVVARLVARFYAGDDVGRQDTVAWVAYGAVAPTLAVAAVVWGRHRPIGRVAADLG